MYADRRRVSLCHVMDRMKANGKLYGIRKYEKFGKEYILFPTKKFLIETKNIAMAGNVERTRLP